VTEVVTVSRFFAEEKHREAVREVRLRREIYARSGIDHRTNAKRRVAVMQEIADDYEKLIEKERLL
jgi:hypothetical protein